MRIRRWYWALLALWAVTGLPIYLLGQAFGGRRAFSIEGLQAFLDPPRISHFEAFATWLWPTLLILSPILALPFAFVRKPKQATAPREGTDDRGAYAAGRWGRVRGWYWMVLAFWVAGGFWYVFAAAFADGSFSGQSLLAFMAPSEASVGGILIWIWGLVLISLPLLLIPFAVVRHRRKPEGNVAN